MWWMSAAVAACLAGAAPQRMGEVDGLPEISGLVVSDEGTLWTLQDSGRPADLVELDATGRLLRTVHVEATNTDWEELAIGACPTGRCLYIADFGDNEARRAEVAILRVPLPGLGVTSVRPEVLRFRYPEGPQNAEAMVVLPDGGLRVFTKREDGTAIVYEVPATFDAGIVEARRQGVLQSGSAGKGSRATGATLHPDGSLLLRTYTELRRYPAAGGRWASAGETLPVASEPQGEAVAWDTTRRGYWTISEREKNGPPATVWFVACGP